MAMFQKASSKMCWQASPQEGDTSETFSDKVMKLKSIFLGDICELF